MAGNVQPITNANGVDLSKYLANVDLSPPLIINCRHATTIDFAPNTQPDLTLEWSGVWIPKEGQK